VSVDELFRGAAPVQSAEDLAEDGVFDDGELGEFLADLSPMRRAGGNPAYGLSTFT
jgi:hypothetical protein